MAGHLLLVVLMYSFSEKKAQALLPSVSVSQCYFHIERGKPGKVFSCLKNLTGTELLEMTHQSSPAEVKVTCFYLYGSSSPDSDVSSIIIRTLLPPKLTVNPAVIKDTDSVTLNCQTPSSVSVSQCYFYTVNGGTAKVLSCPQTLTATELLEMAHQSSPAKIQVTCFYTVKIGEFNYPSPHSDRFSITIHSLTLPAAGTLTPADTTLMKPASGDQKTESLILVIGAVVTVGVLLPGLALLFTQSRTEKSVSKRPKTIITGLLDGFDETYSIVTYECSSE